MVVLVFVWIKSDYSLFLKYEVYVLFPVPFTILNPWISVWTWSALLNLWWTKELSGEIVQVFVLKLYSLYFISPPQKKF